MNGNKNRAYVYANRCHNRERKKKRSEKMRTTSCKEKKNTMRKWRDMTKADKACDQLNQTEVKQSKANQIKQALVIIVGFLFSRFSHSVCRWSGLMFFLLACLFIYLSCSTLNMANATIEYMTTTSKQRNKSH